MEWLHNTLNTIFPTEPQGAAPPGSPTKVTPVTGVEKLKLNIRRTSTCESNMGYAGKNLIIGKLGRGSRTVAIELLQKVSELRTTEKREVVVYCGDEGSQKRYIDLFKKDLSFRNHAVCHVSPQFNAESLSEHVKAHKSKYRKSLDDGSATDTRPTLAVVVDNALSSNQFRERILREILMNGRSLNISLIINTQDAGSFPPDMRTCFNSIYIAGGYNDLSIKKRIFNNYAGIVPTFQMFCDIYDSLTKTPYTWMVVNNCIQSCKIEDVISWYCADRA